MSDTKICIYHACRKEFQRPPHLSLKQWNAKGFCSEECRSKQRYEQDKARKELAKQERGEAGPKPKKQPAQVTVDVPMPPVEFPAHLRNKILAKRFNLSMGYRFE